MIAKAYAHSLPGKSKDKWQPLDEHLKSVAEKAREFASAFGSGDWGYLAGLWHDLGKYSETFQEKLRVPNGEDAHIETASSHVDHSTAGTQYVLEQLNRYAERSADSEVTQLARLIAQMIAHCIAGHHSGLLDGFSSGDGPSLKKRLEKTEVPSFQKNIDRSIQELDKTVIRNALSEDLLDSICRWIMSEDAIIQGRDAFSLQFKIRMLFSTLVDADRLDAERARNPEQHRIRMSVRTDPLAVLLQKLERHISSFSRDGIVNRIRNEVSEQCAQASCMASGFFSLTVPTGGGKTFASLRFALRHALLKKKCRIIYVMPYTSIIDQNADVFRTVLDRNGDTQNVLEHHSNLEPEKETEENRLLAENWSAPIIATTSVQFFDSLYSNKPGRCRRLHSICNSVIILDEAQTVPVRYLKAITWGLEELVTNYGCSVVFCTATQPLLDSEKIDGRKPENQRIGIKDIRPIIANPAELFQKLKRAEVKRIKADNPLTHDKIADHIKHTYDGKKSVLCVVNTKKCASAIFIKLKKTFTDNCAIFHLSTGMCPQHRADVLAVVKPLLGYARKIGAKHPLLVSTQLIEAGVNLDFDVVFRAMAGVDSIAQAAGRCNREGQLPRLGEVYVYDAEEKLGRLTDIIEAQRAGRSTLSVLESTIGLSDDDRNPLGTKAVEEYFERLYWSRYNDMDLEGIIASLSARHCIETAGDIPFATIGDKFKLIKEDTVSILVPYGAEGYRMVESLVKGGTMGFEEYRLARRYSIQIWRSALPDYKSIIEETKSGWLVLNSNKYYDERGLLRPDALGVEEYIV